MRICYIADGISIHTQRWANYFAEKGHEVHLISFRFTQEYEGFDKRIEFHPLVMLLRRVWKVSKYLSAILWLLQARMLVKEIKPDILHAQYIAVYGFLGASSGFHPFILSAWGSDVLVEPKNSRISKLTVRFALRRADVTLTTSEYLKGYLQGEFNLPQHSIRAIPWGVDFGIFHKGYETAIEELKARLGVDDGDFVILSPRTLRELYRIEYIVQAMPHIVAKYPKVTLILLKGTAEDREYETRIDNLSTELGTGENTRMIRQELSPQEMAVLYNASDALISIPGSDQFSSCIQEGMACGVIPIVGKLEVYHQYLTDGKNAFFVDPEDPQQIAKKVIYCIEHPELKERFYKINRKIIEEKENWDKNAQKMERLYASLLAQKSKEDSREHEHTLI